MEDSLKQWLVDHPLVMVILLLLSLCIGVYLTRPRG